jgi:subtilisin family serine protease
LGIALFLFPILCPPAVWAGEKVLQRERIMTAIERDGRAKVIVRIRAGEAGRKRMIGSSGDEGETKHVSAVSRKIMTALSGISHRTRHAFTSLPFLALDVTADALALLEAHPDVIAVAEDRLRPVGDGARASAASEHAAGPSETGAAAQASSQNLDLIGAPQAWSLHYTGQGWYVAVVDTGVLVSHEMFAGKTVIEACFSADGDCPNGRTEMIGPGAARPFDRLYDGYEHGTHVAGIAVGNSGRNFGVARDADLIAVQVFSRFPGRECGGVPCLLSYDSDQLRALDYIYSLRGTYRIASVNMSLGGGDYTSQASCDEDNLSVKMAVERLRSAGIATVIAGGNDGSCGSLEAPGCISSAVAVGAVDDSDIELSSNNWHYSMLDVLAPGRLVSSAVPDSPTSYVAITGTSMATPHVAGAWAVLKQKNPDASVSDVLETLVSTGRPVQTVCTSIDDYKPRLHVGAALSPTPVPAPADVSATSYAPTASPVLNVSQLMPLGVGAVAGSGDSVDIQVGFYKFSDTVDIYLGIYAPAIDPSNVYLVLPGTRFQPLSGGFVPWKSGISGPVGESLFGELPATFFPPGLYTLYVVVTPVQRIDRYTIWSTDFFIP